MTRSIPVLLVFLLLVGQQAHAATRVALVSTCGGKAGQNVLALAEAKLSAEKGVAVVERTLVERVLDEQKLTHCGLSDSAQALAVGKLLGVEVFATLETFSGSGEALGLVVFDARSGAKLWDVTLPAGGMEVTADGIVAAVRKACEKRLRPISNRRTVCLLSVRNAELPRGMDSFCESVGQLLERGLLGSASLTVLERERLEQINRERLLPTNEVPNDLLPSLTLLELEFSRGSESNGVKATVFLTDASRASLGKVQAVGSIERVTDLVEALLQRLAQSLKATPSIRGVDRPREAVRFRQEAAFFIEHMQFAKGLQAAEAAYALNSADKESRALLADALLKAANDLLAPGQPQVNSWASKVAPDDLKRALDLAQRGADLCLEIRGEMPSDRMPHYFPWSEEEKTLTFFLLRARNTKQGYDDESRRQLAELQAKCRRILIEFWERPACAAITDSSRFNTYRFNFYWLLCNLELASATSAGWTTDAVDALDHWLTLVDRFELCNLKADNVNWMLSPIVYRMKEPAKMFEGCYGQCWSLSEADLARLHVVFDGFKRHPNPLFQLYGMASELAETIRKEGMQSGAADARLQEIKHLGMEAISHPLCERSDDYRAAVYQALLDTIDLLPDPDMRHREYQGLFDSMLARREYFHWVAMAAVDPDSGLYQAYQTLGSVFPRDKPPKGDPKTCARNLERALVLLGSPDCRRIGEPLSFRGPLDQQLAKLRESLAAEQPALKLPTPAPWGAARLLDGGRSALLQPRVFGNAVWGLEAPLGETSAMRLRLVRVPLDGSPPQQYDRVPTDGPPDKFYAAVIKDGILIFPAAAAAVNRLTETNGLPSSDVSAVACSDGKLYAGIGENSGYQGTAGYLIMCELATGRVTVLASSMRKEKLSALDDVSPPFFIRQMIADPARHRMLFTVDIGTYQGGMPYTGLWSVDTQDGKLAQLVPLLEPCEWVSQIRGNEILLACRHWGKAARYAVLSFNLKTNNAKLVYASDWSDVDQALIGSGHVCKIPLYTYPPHLILDGFLWAANPFCRFPADGKPREFLPSFAEGHQFWPGDWRLLEPLENGRQILAGVGNQLWLLDLKPGSPAAASDTPKDSP